MASIGVVSLYTSGCGEDGTMTPQPEGGSRHAVAKEIRLAEQRQAWGTRQEFCGPVFRRRSVNQPTAAGLILERSSVRRGARTFVRIENRGAAALAYGVEPQFDQFAGGIWHPRQVVRDGHPVGFSLDLIELKPHTASGCIEVPISDTWGRGLYRVRFSLESWEHRGTGRTIQTGAYFRVSTRKLAKESRDPVDRRAVAMRPVHWKVIGEPRGRILRIASDVAYCDESPMPRIKRVRVEEPAREVLLTAMLTTTVRSADIACAGVRLGVSKTVALKQDVAGRAIYDASFSPPRKRWPR